MSSLTFRHDLPVQLIQHVGTDDMVAKAARISTNTEEKEKGTRQLIEFLMANRHGSPFEHNSFTFRVEAPIFVWREFMRHRIGFSYNEMSGRYAELPPSFYIPDYRRPLTQVGKPGAYEFVAGSAEQYDETVFHLKRIAERAYGAYQLLMLDQEVAKEVARMCLPVNIYSAAYVTCNARSIMSFLSLRTKHPDSKFPSFPQREIEIVAEQIERLWWTAMPITARSFTQNGRVSP